MDVSVYLFLTLLLAVGLLRLVELQISKRHQREMAARGAAKVDEPKFRWMVLLHTAVLIGAALEVVFLGRPFLLWLAAPMFVLFLVANAVRWWVIRSLGTHWNAQVVDSTRLGVVPPGLFATFGIQTMRRFLPNCWLFRSFTRHGSQRLQGLSRTSQSCRSAFPPKSACSSPILTIERR